MIRRWYVRLALIILPTVIFVGITPPAFAESTIQARICDGAQGAMLMIASPASDSLIDVSDITITGSVSQSNQLEIFVDDAFNSVVPLASSASSFSTTIQLSAGTHKVTVTAVDACQVDNASLSIVLTYQPTYLPSTGSEIPTGISGGGDFIGSQQVAVNPIEAQPPKMVIEQYIAPVFSNIADSLDLQSSSPDNTSSSELTSMHRFAMTICGLGLMLAASPITAFISTVLAVGAADASKWRVTARRVIRAVGAILVTLIFIL